MQKQKRKNEAINEAEKKAKALSKCKLIRLKAQCVANQIKLNALITRVIPSPTDNGFKYIINYVTDVPMNDWYMYVEIAEKLGKIYHCKFKLCHAKLLDGKYMTIDEWKMIFLS